MSSTGRGNKRQTNDFYATPEWLVDAIVGHMHLRMDDGSVPRTILEPACGDGAIVKKLVETYPQSLVYYTDLFPQQAFPCPKADFIDEFNRLPKHDLIITNPPYSLAEDFVYHGIQKLNPGGRLALLLRVNFFGGQERSMWLKDWMPKYAPVTPRRPSFVNKGTDSTEYAWFIWGKEPNTETVVTLLNTQKESIKAKYAKSLKCQKWTV